MGTFIRLVDYNNADGKKDGFFLAENKYIIDDKKFKYVPGELYAYWISQKIINTFEDNIPVSGLAEGKVGLQTGSNDLFLRFWFEVSKSNISFHGEKTRWFLYNKGGGFRRWYGNNEYVVDWENDGNRIKKYGGAFPRNTKYYFKDGITWSDVKSGLISMRRMPSYCAFDTCAPCLFSNENEDLLLAFFNSKVGQVYMDFMSSPMHYTCGALLDIPIIKPNFNFYDITKKCVNAAKLDWDSFEISWDFTTHPLVIYKNSLEVNFEKWKNECNMRFEIVKNGEEEINSLFLEAYDLCDELSQNVCDEEISIRLADKQREIKSLISYAIGCIMGRYSLKENGLICSGRKLDDSRYSEEFQPCEYGIIPITEEQYFPQDLCTRVIDFISVVYGEDTLKENLEFIAHALKPESTELPKKIIREYLFNGFFDNHYQIYQHRPIYWQLDSGKAGGFRALVYMHRYNENTLPIVRTEYLQELRYKYEDELQRLQNRLVDTKTTADKNQLKKNMKVIDNKIVECAAYDDLLNHATSNIKNYVFDLDDGVKTNYAKFLSIAGDKNKNILTVIKL